MAQEPRDSMLAAAGPAAGPAAVPAAVPAAAPAAGPGAAPAAGPAGAPAAPCAVPYAGAACAPELSPERPDESRIVDFNAVHAAILTETLKLADSLLRQAARDIEATLFERVFDRLRAALPELVDRALHEHAAAEDPKAATAEPRD